MEYSEFVNSWKQQSHNVTVNRSKALQVMNRGILPKQYQYAHIFWTWVWILMYPVGIALMFFTKWWIGLIFLIFVPGTISTAVKKSAMQFMIDHALENPEFYKFAIEQEIIILEN
jgi:hypothetical protein